MEAYSVRKFAVVKFPEYADAARTDTEDHKLTALVKQNQVVVYDLSECKEMDHPWVRLLTVLTVRAKEKGKLVAIVGAGEGPKRTADYIGHLNHWRLFESVDQVVRGL